jgi:hypothetical protein
LRWAGKLWKTLSGGGGRCGVGCGDVKQMTFDESEMRPRESRIQSEFDLFPLSIASASSSAPHCDRQNQSKDTTRAHPPVKRFPLTRFRFSIHPYAKEKQKSCDCPIDLYLEVEITNLCSSSYFLSLFLLVRLHLVKFNPMTHANINRFSENFIKKALTRPEVELFTRNLIIFS